MKRNDGRRAGVMAVLAAMLVCGLAMKSPARGDEAGAAARAISEKQGEAVVTVRVVVKFRMSMEGEEASEEESTNETRGTVIDPSGLTACSLAEIDPSHMMKLMEEEEDPGYKIETQVTGVKLVMADGREIPAKVVLRDQDLDLAFVRPEEPPATPFVAVDLTQSAAPQVMDELVVLGRLGEAANRSVWTGMDRVTAIVTKPRTFYMASINTWMAGLGCPAFTPDGKVVGITVMRAIPAASGSAGGSNSTPVVLPAADVLKVSKQAG